MVLDASMWDSSPVPARWHADVKKLLPCGAKAGSPIVRKDVAEFLDSMGIKVITPSSNALDSGSRAVISETDILTIDVRSPKEYEQGHIPGAVSLPLLSNEDRHIVGKIYAQQGKQPAIDSAMAMVLPALSRIPERCTGHCKVYVYCWRGGMRSSSVAWFLHAHGIDASVLNGGYKGFRHYVVGTLCRPPRAEAPDIASKHCRKHVDIYAELQTVVGAPGAHRAHALSSHGVAYLNTDSLSEAFASFEAAARELTEGGVTTGRLPWTIYCHLAECHLQFGEDQAALDTFSRAEVCRPGHTDLRVHKGKAVAFARLGLRDNAIAVLELALAENGEWRLGKQLLNALRPPDNPQDSDMSSQQEPIDPWDMTFGTTPDTCYCPAVSSSPLPVPLVVVLSGPTGSGKTDILHELRRMGQQFIDLEGLAHHRASTFGAVGMPPQPSNEMFENLVFVSWRAIDESRPVWLEHEDHHIGTCSTPSGIITHLNEAPGGFILIDMSRELRVQRLVADYCGLAVGAERMEQLVASVVAMEKRWGRKRVDQCVEQLHNHDFAAVADDALVYYDKLYRIHAEKTAAITKSTLKVSLHSVDAAENARLILSKFAGSANHRRQRREPETDSKEGSRLPSSGCPPAALLMLGLGLFLGVVLAKR